MRRSLGSSEGPLGTAQERKVPSYSSRKSKCRWLAACFWMTKRSACEGTTFASAPEGSAVCDKSRICWYLASLVATTVLLRLGIGFQRTRGPHDPGSRRSTGIPFRARALDDQETSVMAQAAVTRQFSVRARHVDTHHARTL